MPGALPEKRDLAAMREQCAARLQRQLQDPRVRAEKALERAGIPVAQLKASPVNDGVAASRGSAGPPCAPGRQTKVEFPTALVEPSVRAFSTPSILDADADARGVSAAVVPGSRAWTALYVPVVAVIAEPISCIPLHAAPAPRCTSLGRYPSTTHGAVPPRNGQVEVPPLLLAATREERNTFSPPLRSTSAAPGQPAQPRRRPDPATVDAHSQRSTSRPHGATAAQQYRACTPSAGTRRDRSGPGTTPTRSTMADVTTAALAAAVSSSAAANSSPASSARTMSNRARGAATTPRRPKPPPLPSSVADIKVATPSGATRSVRSPRCLPPRSPRSVQGQTLCTPPRRPGPSCDESPFNVDDDWQPEPEARLDFFAVADDGHDISRDQLGEPVSFCLKMADRTESRSPRHVRAERAGAATGDRAAASGGAEHFSIGDEDQPINSAAAMPLGCREGLREWAAAPEQPPAPVRSRKDPVLPKERVRQFHEVAKSLETAATAIREVIGIGGCVVGVEHAITYENAAAFLQESFVSSSTQQAPSASASTRKCSKSPVPSFRKVDARRVAEQPPPRQCSGTPGRPTAMLPQAMPQAASWSRGHVTVSDASPRRAPWAATAPKATTPSRRARPALAVSPAPAAATAVTASAAASGASKGDPDAHLRGENEALRGALGNAAQRLAELECERELFLSEGVFDFVNTLCREQSAASLPAGPLPPHVGGA